MKIKKNFLSPDLLKALEEKNAEELTKEIKHSYSLAYPQNHLDLFDPLTFHCETRVFEVGDEIQWHRKNEPLFSIIYLTKDWHKEDGGLFLFKLDNEQILAEVPDYNKMILDYGRFEQATTPVKKQLKVIIVSGTK